MLFQIIASFEVLEQLIIEINVDVENEEKFIYYILDQLDDNEIKDLIKLSICNIAKTKSQSLKWLYDRNGKYYFNYEVNDDDDTKKWYQLKLDYLKNSITL
jgi:negative regulator of genetic competence, sporulation and motility